MRATPRQREVINLVVKDAGQPHVVIARNDCVERSLRTFAVREEVERDGQCGHGVSEPLQGTRRIAQEEALDARERLFQPDVPPGAGEWGREVALLQQSYHPLAVTRGVARQHVELLSDRRNGQEDEQERDREEQEKE
jgi:hypothetical protein